MRASPAQEDSTRRGAAKPSHHSYWAGSREPVLCHKRSRCHEKLRIMTRESSKDPVQLNSKNKEKAILKVNKIVFKKNSRQFGPQSPESYRFYSLTQCKAYLYACIFMYSNTLKSYPTKVNEVKEYRNQKEFPLGYKFRNSLASSLG